MPAQTGPVPGWSQDHQQGNGSGKRCPVRRPATRLLGVSQSRRRPWVPDRRRTGLSRGGARRDGPRPLRPAVGLARRPENGPRCRPGGPLGAAAPREVITHAPLTSRAARPAQQNRGITPIPTASGAVGRLKSAWDDHFSHPAASRPVSRRGDRPPVHQARPPGTAGRYRGETSTYLPNVNVPFSHPSGGRAQKDGRKVRPRDELPLTLGRSPRPTLSR